MTPRCLDGHGSPLRLTGARRTAPPILTPHVEVSEYVGAGGAARGAAVVLAVRFAARLATRGRWVLLQRQKFHHGRLPGVVDSGSGGYPESLSPHSGPGEVVQFPAPGSGSYVSTCPPGRSSNFPSTNWYPFGRDRDRDHAAGERLTTPACEGGSPPRSRTRQG